MVAFKAAAAALIGLASASDIVRREPDDVYPNYDLLENCPGYKATRIRESSSGIRADLTLDGEACNVYGRDLKELTLEVVYQSADRIHVKIQDKRNQVFQVPEEVFPRPEGTHPKDDANISFNYVESPFSFSITRGGPDGEVLFDTSAASLVFESQYLRLRTHLPMDPYLYGLGEHSDTFRLNNTDYVRTLWNQDSYGIPEGANLYGSQPFYIELRDDNKAHGVFFLNANGQDIIIDKEKYGEGDEDHRQFLEYNSLGGVLDFYFFSGPTAIDVTKQYAEITGNPTMQPYWGLGFHNCRYGYRDVFDTAEVVQNYSDAKIPLETMWQDIDYMDRRRVFSLDPERFPLDIQRDFVDELHARDQHLIVMVDPAVAYVDGPVLQRGIDDNIWLLRKNGSVWLGVVWPGVTVFPDWFAENIGDYWNNEFDIFFNAETGLDIDALWIDMNEPSNFPCYFPCDDPYGSAEGYPPEPPPVREWPRELPGWPCSLQPEGTECEDGSTAKLRKREPSVVEEMPRDFTSDKLFQLEQRQDAGDQSGLPNRNLLRPQYSIHNAAANKPTWNAEEGGLSNKTVNTNVLHQNGLAMYDTHNLYGSMMSLASYDAMLARRPGLRPMIITRSTWAGAGRRVGKWLGDNLSTWEQYRASIRTQLAYTSIFQISMVGSDACGFGGNTTEELCSRWASLAAFSSFYRNHNEYGANSQEFYRWDTVAESARKAIEARYKLLDYFYTQMYKANQDGTPVLYPMFYLYPEDTASRTIELQFFYGPGILVSPALAAGDTDVAAYFPEDLFYDWYTHEPLVGSGLTVFLDAPLTHIPLHIRAGVIIPVRVEGAMTTTELRKKDFEIIVPLREDGTAEGQLYLDDGESIDSAFTLLDFTYKNGKLSATGEFGYPIDVPISKITVLRPEGNNQRQQKSRDVKIDLNEAFEFDF